MELYGLLPEKVKDLRSVDYWESYFKNLNGQPSECFSEWDQLQPVVSEVCQGKRILVTGSGMSQLSARMYDEGIEDITNIDFSKLAIREQLTKNLRERPKMKWQVMDMTNMKGFRDGDFEVVVDKGALDTLLGDDSREGEKAATQYLEEVARVLSPQGGVFICNTLAQTAVMRLVLGGMAFGWDCVFHKVSPLPSHASDAVQPLLMVLQKTGTAKLGTVAAAFDVQEEDANKDQLQFVLEMVGVSLAERKQMRQAQEQDCLGFHPGRRMYAELPRPSCNHNHKHGESCGPHHQHHHDRPRYHAIVLDAIPEAAAQAKHNCAVFIVPQGREHEDTFSSPQGQWQLLHRCSASRLIIIVLERGVNYHSYQVVRSELQGMVLDLTPLACRQHPDSIVFLSTPEGIGRRWQLSERDSNVREGSVLVEDVKLQEHTEEQILRRLVLLSHRAVILSEQLQCPPHHPPKTKPSSTTKPKSSKKASKINKKAEKAEALHGPIASSGPVVDRLVSSSHKAAVAGLMRLLGPGISTNGGTTSLSCVVIGGGGCVLPTYLTTCLNAKVEIAEQDEAVVKLAKQFFGYQDGPNMQLHVKDGVDVVAAMSDSSLQCDVMVVDAVAVEPTGAIQCPPLAFVTSDFLSHAKTVVGPSGVVLVNTAAVPTEYYNNVLQALQAAFPFVYFLPAEDDASQVLFGTSLELQGVTENSWEEAVGKFTQQQLPDSPVLSELFSLLAPVVAEA